MDIKFTVNTGDHKGETYRYTLATVNGKKAWAITPLFSPPPSMIKNKIDIVIECREHNISRSGATELALAGKILDELSIIATETEPSTLTGLDKKDRLVMIDQDGFSITTELKEKGKEPEYRINVTCWGLYE